MNFARIAKETIHSGIRHSLSLGGKQEEVVSVKQFPPDNEDLVRLCTFIKNCDDEYRWTPDWAELELREFQPVFLYCDFMKGGKQYDAIKDILHTKDNGKVVTPRAFTSERYEVWQTRDGTNSIPIALTSNAPPISALHETTLVRPARVQGQLFEIHSGLIKELDKRKSNGVISKRRKIDIQLPKKCEYTDDYGNTRTVIEVCDLKVWAYVGKHRHWDQFLDGGFNLRRCGFANHVPPWIKEPVYYFKAHKIARGQEP